VTTDSIVSADSRCSAIATAKQGAVISGIDIFFAVFRELDPASKFSKKVEDGHRVRKGNDLCEIECNTRALLSGERTALNILQRMCGIATQTARFVKKTVGTRARISDTRKTAPGMRPLDKYAVTCGGGFNHRFGLFDGILIKDNHIKAAGSIKKAVEKARRNSSHLLSIEVEASSMEQVEEALEARVEAILLDNMTPEEIRAGVKKIGGRAKVEASGGINLANVRKYALAGPDFISVGALTHSVTASDISLNIRS
jgi:nicotinate-nucleotide pyrophosphorylase (carboxylating)